MNLTTTPINNHYFIAIFKEVVESKIEDPLGCLARLIKSQSRSYKLRVNQALYSSPTRIRISECLNTLREAVWKSI